MKAIVVRPGFAESLELTDLPEPQSTEGLLIETLAIGICGTDHEIIERAHGQPPPGRDRLVLGHESLGRVVEAPADSALAEGDLVVAMVRRPDPEPCSACQLGHYDMCLNGRYSEAGIKGLDGYASERFRVDSEFVIALPRSIGIHGVLAEPMSIVTKAWRRITALAEFNLRPLGSALVTGAGPIGLLAALVAKGDGLEVHVLDRISEGPKPDLVRALGATYHADIGACPETDVVIECTGASSVLSEILARSASNSVTALLGVSEHSDVVVDMGEINRELVLENDLVFGSVNSGRQDYEEAVSRLVATDKSWLDALITRRMPVRAWREAYTAIEDDIKTIIEFASVDEGRAA